MLELCVKKVAIAKGLTVAEIAKLAGISHNTATKFWHGKITQLDLPTLSKIARALGVPQKDLLIEVELETEENTTPLAA